MKVIQFSVRKAGRNLVFSSIGNLSKIVSFTICLYDFTILLNRIQLVDCINPVPAGDLVEVAI